MLTYLEGTRYKIQSTLLELDHKQRGSHPLAPHIQLTRDRNGLQQSILKVPLWLKGGSNEGDAAASGAPAAATNDDEYVNRFIEQEPTDVRNEAVIGSYRSQLELTSPCEFTAQSLADSVPNGVASRGGVDKIKTIDEIDRGIADGGSNQQDSDFGKILTRYLEEAAVNIPLVLPFTDEFSSHDEAEDEEQVDKNASVAVEQQEQRVVIGRCRAMYSYTPKLYDELELEPGDIIAIHTKEENGWWLGELKSRVGIFPATYVEELQP